MPMPKVEANDDEGGMGHPFGLSPSKMPSRQANMKMIDDDSADRLLEKSPTELGFAATQSHYSAYTQSQG